MNWYIVQAYSGFEKKVVESIKDELKKKKINGKIRWNLSSYSSSYWSKKRKKNKKGKKIFSRLCTDKNWSHEGNLSYDQKSTKS